MFIEIEKKFQKISDELLCLKYPNENSFYREIPGLTVFNVLEYYLCCRFSNIKKQKSFEICTTDIPKKIDCMIKNNYLIINIKTNIIKNYLLDNDKNLVAKCRLLWLSRK